ncbi:MAG: hypothetical protein WB948_01895, partial [Desulfobaccales bacterium]
MVVLDWYSFFCASPGGLRSAAMKKFLSLFFCLLFLAGCAANGNQGITQQGNLDRIQEGKSTKADVQNAVGT